MAQAIRYAEYGGPEVLELQEITLPEPGPGEVRIAVRAAGVNPIDWKIRSGAFTPGQELAAPRGTGIEAAGVVDAVGPDVDTVAPGDEVFGNVGGGAAATHVIAQAAALVQKPDWLSFEEAAALPVAAETSVRTLRYLDVHSGQTLLVHAATGAVGLVASQLAIARGLTVVGTAGPGRHEFLRELGVRPVAYGDGWVDRVREAAPDGIDVVLDASGRGVLAESVALTGDPAKVVTIAGGDTAETGVHFSSGGTEAVPTAEVFTEALPLLRSGRLRLPVAKTFPLAQAADAHRLSEDGHVLGKIVFRVG
ncbi:NADP-dependent oxidoreductase [Amycolatopsis sp. YIM 10]|uniref:NADP-dependent oxidoreductase n=1 Tax=Amycolatopsis sp. YIM 10 TaxID=2653857 RepID=UPI0012904D3D|nr:NADP-dependent oxidoreductase [Amycolatopsis sp. YIM 10]QFU86062.1 Quinone oxidoreductase 1 [Amycolatopsis sp. YIM 10]